MRVLVDMDGVIADFEGEFLRQWRFLHPDRAYIPIDKRTSFYIVDQYPQEERERIHKILWSPGFFRDLQPIPGAIQALHEMIDLGLEVFICSSPLSGNKSSASDKYEWTVKNVGCDWGRKLILTKDKTLVRGDILIDDNPYVRGVDTPAWEHIVYDRSYNRCVDRRRLTWLNWKSVLLSKT